MRRTSAPAAPAFWRGAFSCFWRWRSSFFWRWRSRSLSSREAGATSELRGRFALYVQIVGWLWRLRRDGAKRTSAPKGRAVCPPRGRPGWLRLLRCDLPAFQTFPGGVFRLFRFGRFGSGDAVAGSGSRFVQPPNSFMMSSSVYSGVVSAGRRINTVVPVPARAASVSSCTFRTQLLITCALADGFIQ